jgi:hypothetical protein
METWPDWLATAQAGKETPAIIKKYIHVLIGPCRTFMRVVFCKIALFYAPLDVVRRFYFDDAD